MNQSTNSLGALQLVQYTYFRGKILLRRNDKKCGYLSPTAKNREIYVYANLPSAE